MVEDNEVYADGADTDTGYRRYTDTDDTGYHNILKTGMKMVNYNCQPAPFRNGNIKRGFGS